MYIHYTCSVRATAAVAAVRVNAEFLESYFQYDDSHTDYDYSYSTWHYYYIREAIARREHDFHK